MELTNAKALLAKITSDPEVAKIFAAITSAEAFEAEAKKMGYSCTLDEFVEAKKTAVQETSGELSDDELQQTSGGLSLVGVDYSFTVIMTASN